MNGLARGWALFRVGMGSRFAPAGSAACQWSAGSHRMFSSDVSEEVVPEVKKGRAARLVPEEKGFLPPDATAVFDFKMRESMEVRHLKQYRKEGWIPGTILAFPQRNGGPRANVHILVNAKQVQRQADKLQRHNMAARVYYLRKEGSRGAGIRVVPKQMHQTTVTDKVENINFQYCRPGQKIKVKVPVNYEGLDVSPGLKKGGIINEIRQGVHLICPGDRIPETIIIDVSSMDIGGRVFLHELDIPEGAEVNYKHHTRELPVMTVNKN